MRPTTVDEIKALPIGPEFGQELKIVDGRQLKVPFPRPTQATWFADGDLRGYSDETGHWQIGQYTDGGYFRRRIAG